MFNKHRLAWLIPAALILLALAASGCASSSKSEGTGSGNTTVNVDMTNFAFKLDQAAAQAGNITFHVKNSDSGVDHEMVLIKTDLDAKQLPTKSDQTVDESQLESKGEVEVEPGETKDLTANLPAGHYVLLCNEPGHFASGMAANFTVQ